LTAAHPFAGIALALIIMCWPFLRWALKLWFDGVFPLPSPPALTLALYRQSKKPAASAAPPHSSHGGRKAYLNFELKDAPQARRLRRSTILDFKVQIGSGQPSDKWVFPRHARVSNKAPAASRHTRP
jgi:hypothetical protein